MLALVFWLSVLVVVHSYVLYPLSLVALDALRRARSDDALLQAGPERRALGGREPPSVSVLVAAHNEAACIEAKVKNTAELDYAPGKHELLVGSDGSTDATEALARKHEGPFVRVLSTPRGGKAAMLGRLAEHATGDLLVFTDANTVLGRGALLELARAFEDPDVGCVLGNLRLVGRGEAGRSEGAYWRYERLLKLWESRLGAGTGAAGGLYAIRRRLWRPLPSGTVVDDFLVSMRVLLAGEKVAFAPLALAEEDAPDAYADEFRRRARIAAGNWHALAQVTELLSPRRGLVAYALWSHKVLRWTTPAFLALALASSLVLAADGSGFYAALLAAQSALYASALLNSRGLKLPLSGLCRHFVEMNAALAVGAWRFFRGAQGVTWAPTARATR